MMFVHTAFSFYALRFLLGLAEAGFYPGIILYLTYWVPGNVRARVIARFLSLTAILGLVGGPLGGLLLKLNGMLGLAGWQWLFVLEGVPSMLFGFVVLAVLPDGPAQAKWLLPQEKEWITARMAQEAKNERQVQHLSVRVALSEPRILLMCLIFILTATGGNAIGFFGPQLIKSRSGGLWTDSYVATISVLPAIVGAIAMVIAAAHSDRTGRRRRHVAIGYFVAGLGFVACVYAPNAPWTLVALSLNALGERTAAGSYWALTSNLMGARAAAGGIAFINSVGNLGGFFGPTLMGELKNRTHGGYTAGLTVAAGMMMAASVLAYLLRLLPSAEAPVSSELTSGLAAASQPEQHTP
jgi:ACS family tartrate transporter-like MFS transporter